MLDNIESDALKGAIIGVAFFLGGAALIGISYALFGGGGVFVVAGALAFAAGGAFFASL